MKQEAMQILNRTRKGWTLFLALALALGAVLITSPATAAGPTKAPFTKIQTTVLIGVCEFDITADQIFTGTEIDFYNNSGVLTRADYHLAGQDTFTANAKTVAGLPFQLNFQFYFDSAGNVTYFLANGVYEKLRLPNGMLDVAAGHGVIEGYGVSPLYGNPVNVAALCAALAP